MKKAVFLDRDGTINVDFGYVYRPEDLRFIDGVQESLIQLQKAGFMLIIITNQSGVGRGFFTEAQAHAFNELLTEQLKKNGINIADTFMCIHSPEENCNCRKPSPKLVLEAIKKHHIDVKSSYMIGDKNSDVECGENASIKSFLIDKDHSINFWAKFIKDTSND